MRLSIRLFVLTVQSVFATLCLSGTLYGSRGEHFIIFFRFMSHKKAGGSTRLGRDSQPKYLGVKVGDGEIVRPGTVLVRQRGSAIHPGKHVGKGSDDTLFSLETGTVKFTKIKRRRFDGQLKLTSFVSVVPLEVKK